MILDRTDIPRASLLARGEVLPLIDQYLTQVMKQTYSPIPVVTSLRGGGKTAVLNEVRERQSVIGRSVGYGSVKSGLGQALTDAMVSLAEALAARRPGCDALPRIIAAGEEFMRKGPDEGTVAIFGQATDVLLYQLSNEISEVPGGFVVLLDDLDRANESRFRVFVEGLVALGETGAPLPFVFARMQEPGQRLGSGMDEIVLRPLGNGDLADLADRLGLSVETAAVRVLADYGAGLPAPSIEVLSRCSGEHRLTAANIHDAILAYEATRITKVESFDEPFIPPKSSINSTSMVAPDNYVPPTIDGPPVHLPVASAAPAPAAAASAAPTGVPATTSRLKASSTAAAAPAPSAPVAPAKPVPATKVPAAVNSIAPRLPSPKSTRTEGTTAAPAPAAAAPAASGPVTPTASVMGPDGLPRRTPRAAEVAEVAEPVADVAPIVPDITLSPTQKRCVESMIELAQSGQPVTLKLLRRKLGDVSRFSGAATPVVAATKELVDHGVLAHGADDVLSFTPAGDALLASLS